jgi:hypothetical protein
MTKTASKVDIPELPWKELIGCERITVIRAAVDALPHGA